MMSSNIKALATAIFFAIINTSDGYTRIIGGISTSIEAFPYTLSIQDETKIHICGGSLIRPDWVISAAHCFKPNRKYYVEAGITTLYLYKGEQRKVKEVYELAAYSRHKDSMGDIVLVQLDKPFPISKKIQTITLPPPSTGDIPLGIAIVDGWGATGGVKLLKKLQYVKVPIYKQEQCILDYGKFIKEDMFCAGYPQGGKDACRGDSGGPLVLNGLLYGVVSWGLGCAEENSPGIYVKVPYYVEIMESIINSTSMRI